MFRVPRDPGQNVVFRNELLDRASQSLELRVALWQACADDPIFWINAFVWQFNPNLPGEEVGPFITWEFQEDAVKTLIEAINSSSPLDRQDIVIEKSREMGASWLCILVMLWFTLFKKNKKFLLLSRSAEAVDSPDDPDSLFVKIDFILEYLPVWLKGDANVLRRRRMGLRHRGNNSTITGQATTGKSGVSGRATAIFVDEFSQIDEAFEIKGRTADTSGCRIFNFTHKSIGGAAYEMSKDPDVKKLVMHWSQHPYKNRGLYRYVEENDDIEILDKTYTFPADYPFVKDGTPAGPFASIRSPWYDAECRRRKSKRDIAMDLDIDPRGATHQFFDPLLIDNLKRTYAMDPIWQGDVQYDRDTGAFHGLVSSPGGPLCLWINPDAYNRVAAGVFTLGGDLSAGTGATNTCFSIFNVATGEKVGAYIDAHLDPIAAAPIAVALCWCFKSEGGIGAKMAFEMQGPGIIFGKRVIEMGYRELYYREADMLSISRVAATLPGWVPTAKSKRSLLEEYRSALANRLFLNRCWKALDECLSFVYTTNGSVDHGGMKSEDDPSGARENHGDRTIADALALKAAGGRGPTALQKQKALIESPPVNSLAWRRKFHENRRQAASLSWR